jgi:hypothetical protein
MCVTMYGIVNEADHYGFVAEYCRHGSLYLSIEQKKL